jgi:hypothetical protein
VAQTADQSRAAPRRAANVYRNASTAWQQVFTQCAAQERPQSEAPWRGSTLSTAGHSPALRPLCRKRAAHVCSRKAVGQKWRACRGMRAALADAMCSGHELRGARCQLARWSLQIASVVATVDAATTWNHAVWLCWHHRLAQHFAERGCQASSGSNVEPSVRQASLWHMPQA